MNEYEAALGATSVKLHATPDAAHYARLFVSHALLAWELDYLGDDAQSIVSELVTNAVKLGPGPVRDRSGSGLVAVQVRVQGGALVLEVWDCHATLPAPRAAVDDDENGRGLQLVEAFSSRWGVWESDSGGKVVYADLDLHKPPAVSLEGKPIELPDEVLAAHVIGSDRLHAMADAALMHRFADGLALL
ncbi:ATP-binding protein [Streptomyces sp. NBC_01233]|uniref:ATP-binding protein n=1 Tax=Streptomyces sp. NBC_01233 TaxID=2903787 RepID=UPI002E1467AF|nr:ATP-binding protein [Streptomyces sp. NBC_01233]